MSNFQQRILFSSAFLIILSVVIAFALVPIFQPIFTLLVAAVIATALWEFYHISRAKDLQPLSEIGLTGSVFYILALFLSVIWPSLSALPYFVLAATLLSSFLYYFVAGKNPLVNLAVTIFGIAYITLPLSCLIPIIFKFGRFWLAYLLIVTKMNDIAAYFCGKKWGAHKMTPFISPKKTWEGAIGGFLAGVLSSVFLWWLSQNVLEGAYSLTLFQSLWLGAVLSVLAQLGDLSESLLKRDTGVKDSSQLPGLGGMFDIMDSLIFTTPMVYFFLI